MHRNYKSDLKRHLLILLGLPSFSLSLPLSLYLTLCLLWWWQVKWIHLLKSLSSKQALRLRFQLWQSVWHRGKMSDPPTKIVKKRPENFKAKGRHIAGGQSEELSLSLFPSYLTLSVFGNAEIIALPIWLNELKLHLHFALLTQRAWSFECFMAIYISLDGATMSKLRVAIAWAYLMPWNIHELWATIRKLFRHGIYFLFAFIP